MDDNETVCEGVDWNLLAQGRVKNGLLWAW
jgi:hypothetical protein